MTDRRRNGFHGDPILIEKGPFCNNVSSSASSLKLHLWDRKHQFEEGYTPGYHKHPDAENSTTVNQNNCAKLTKGYLYFGSIKDGSQKISPIMYNCFFFPRDSSDTVESTAICCLGSCQLTKQRTLWLVFFFFFFTGFNQLKHYANEVCMNFNTIHILEYWHKTHGVITYSDNPIIDLT